MSLRFQVLGSPGQDNALYVEIDSGSAVRRLLFDCGEGCVRELTLGQVTAVERVFFSHFHFDHVAGFDSFLRCNFARPDCPVEFFGPAGTTEIIHHRLRGVTWNLVAGQPGEVVSAEIDGPRIIRHRFLTGEGFRHAHPLDERPFHGAVVETEHYRVSAEPMDHGTTSLAYFVEEQPRANVDTAALRALGLEPGPWLRTVKESPAGAAGEITVGSQRFSLADLQQRLLTSKPGGNVAYLTDFRLEPSSERRLVAMLNSVDAMVCEVNFRACDAELARRSYHFDSAEVARLAARVAPRRLILFHLSDRYTLAEWQEQAAEIRAAFPRVEWPEPWRARMAT